jgi:hypothetical protein
MKTHTVRTRHRLAAGAAGTLLAGLPLLVALQPRADRVAFAPESGSSFQKQFEVAFDLTLGDLTMMVAGMDMSEGVPSDFELSTEIDLSVVDTYVEVEDGMPLELLRRYQDFEARWETPDGSGEADDGPLSALDGKEIRFKWNPDAETYDVSYEDGEGDEDALERLHVDMDFRAMLPDGEVSEGDTWTLDSEQVAGVILFGLRTNGFSLDMDGELGPMQDLLEAELMPQLEALAQDLTAECTYRGRKTVDGRSLGSIGIELDGEGTIDLAGLILGMIEEQAEGFELDVDITEAVLLLTLEGEGELLWDLEAGRFHAFELAPDLEILVDVLMSIDAGGETQDIEASVELFGSGAWAARAIEE